MTSENWMIIITVIYVGAMVVLSYVVGKKTTKNETEFMIGGREFTPLMTAVGNGSILISGGYLPSIIMYGYNFGMGGMWFYIGWGTGALVALLTWAGFWRTSGAVTPTEWFEYRYGRGGRMAVTIVLLMASLAIVGWQYVGCGGIVGGALGIDARLAMLIVGIVVTAYVALGGIWAATATDLVQFTWVAAAQFIIVPVFLIANYGMPDASQLPENFLNIPFGSLPVVEFVVPSVFTFLMMHQSLLNQSPFWARAAGTRNLKTVKRGWAWTVVIAYVTGIIGAFIGTFTRQLIPTLADGTTPMSALLGILPLPLACLCMAGLMAATMSTCDIYLVASVNQMIRDVAQFMLKIRDTKKLMKWAKWGTVIFGMAAVVFAIIWQRGISMLFAFGTGIGAPMFIFYLDSWLLKIGNGKGAVSAVVASLAVVLYWEVLTDNYTRVNSLWLIFPIALVVLVVVSLLTKDRSEPAKVPAGQSPGELGVKILVSMKKGYLNAGSIIDSLCAYAVDNDLQAADVHRELDVLEHSGLIKRKSERLIGQLYFQLTPEGARIGGEHLDDDDRSALEQYDVGARAAAFLGHLSKGPDTLSHMAAEMKIYMLELNATANMLADRNLVRIFGATRVKVELTDEGRKALSNKAATI